jgi:lambda family phage portal protein
MNILDSVIGWISPEKGLRRAHARRVLRSYQGAEGNRLTNNKRPKNQSADQELMGPHGADALRAWARALVRDNAYAWNVLDTIVSNVIGDGIKPQSVFETAEGEDIEDVNDARDRLWAEWCEVADINGELSFYEIQALAMREMVEAGEVLVRFIYTPNKEFRGISRPVPLAIELIEADRLATDRDNYTLRNKQGGNRIIRGIEVDETGRPVAYHIYPEHPSSPFAVRNREPERVKASEIRHMYRKDRVGQGRGVTWFAPAMSWLRDLGVYVDNEIQASAVASCFAAVIKTDSPAGNLLAPAGEDTTDQNSNTFEYLEPGIVARLKPGESIESVNPSRPNSASEPWINLMLRGICAGTGTSYESVSKDFSNTSYSSSRTSKLEDRPRSRRYQRLIINDLCQPTWDEFVKAASRVNEKSFPTSSEFLDSPRRAAPVEWNTPEQPWVDPQSEQASSQAALASFMSTYQTEIGARGGNWRSTFYQAAKENKIRAKLGLLTEAEQTSRMMAAQTGATSPIDDAAAAEDSGPTGEWMGLSRLQWQRNRKALTDVLNGLSDGSMSVALAKAQLSMIGLSEKNIDAIVADASDGTVDQPLPTEEAANVAS